VSDTRRSDSAAFTARIVKRIGVPDGVRQERIIHALDGIESPVHPGQLIDSGASLWTKAQAVTGFADVDYLLGLDGGGILPAIAVSIASRLPFKLAWKLNLDLGNQWVIKESNAVRPNIYAYELKSGDRVFLVDDEVSTGQTALNAVKTLRDAQVHVVGVLTLVEDARCGARVALTAVGVPLVALYTIPR
jgi:adenine phosphoribosyltransferase